MSVGSLSFLPVCCSRFLSLIVPFVAHCHTAPHRPRCKGQCKLPLALESLSFSWISWISFTVLLLSLALAFLSPHPRPSVNWERSREWLRWMSTVRAKNWEYSVFCAVTVSFYDGASARTDDALSPSGRSFQWCTRSVCQFAYAALRWWIVAWHEAAAASLTPLSMCLADWLPMPSSHLLEGCQSRDSL